MPPWVAPPSAASAATSAAPVGRVGALLAAHPEAVDAVAALLGCTGGWRPVDAAAGVGSTVAALLAEHPETADAVAALLATSNGTGVH